MYSDFGVVIIRMYQNCHMWRQFRYKAKHINVILFTVFHLQTQRPQNPLFTEIFFLAHPHTGPYHVQLHVPADC